MSAPSPLSPPARSLDTSELTRPVEEPGLTSFIADSRATGKPWQRISTGLPRPGVGDIVGQAVPALVPVVAAVFFLGVGGWSLVEAIARFTVEADFPLNLVIVGFVALVGAGVVVSTLQVVRIIRSLGTPRSWWEGVYRITRFAAANELRYGHDEPVSHPGVIFAAGVDRVATQRITTISGRRLEIGNYRYTVPSENRENSSVHHWGYVAITLDRRLPHLLLDAKTNDRSVFGIRTSNLPVDLDPNQRLTLGGEFDEKFTLYAPSDYGRDAFYLFAPDLMALFIDRLGTFDVEIVDDTMLVYGSPFDLLDPQTYGWLTELVDTALARTVRRTESYSDDRALLAGPPPQGSADQPVFGLSGDGSSARNTVAEQGRRLRRRRWGVYSVIGVLVAAFWVYNEVIGPLLGWPTLDG